MKREERVHFSKIRNNKDFKKMKLTNIVAALKPIVCTILQY